MPLISVITPCYNEADNVAELWAAVKNAFESHGYHDFEHLFIDNCSTDGTSDILRTMAASDDRVKVIINIRNYGHARSPHHAMLQARGAAVIGMCADFQDPPELIPEFMKQWELGYKIVAGVKQTTEEQGLRRALRRCYYRLLRSVSNAPLLNDFTGFGLYDRVVIEAFRQCHDDQVYFRGFIAELGYPVAIVSYHQPLRRAGRSKNNLFTLMDVAVAGVTAYGRGHLRLMTLMGFGLAAVSLATSFVFLLLKFAFWNRFGLGWAPLLTGLFFFAAVQLFMLGMIGEYVGAIIEHLRFKPPLIEKERYNLPPRKAGE